MNNLLALHCWSSNIIIVIIIIIIIVIIIIIIINIFHLFILLFLHCISYPTRIALYYIALYCIVSMHIM